MKDIQVSIIIPVYNEEAYLPQCLDSILAQTLQQFEVICVDDGSTDRSLEILNTYMTRDARVKVVTQENRYAGVARNLGMQYAKGKYLSFLDADDFFSPFMLERLYETAERQSSDIVICNAYLYDSVTGQISKRKVWGEEEFLPERRQAFSREDIPSHLFQLTNGWAWDKLFRASFIQTCKLDFSDTRVANDGYFVYMALALAKCITKIEDFLVTQRVNNKHSLSNTRNQSWYCGIQMLYDIKRGLEKAGLYNRLEKTFLNFALKYLVWAFESLKDWRAKGEIYRCIQNECREKLGILRADRKIFYNEKQYETYSYIETHGYDDYLVEMLENRTQELVTCREKTRQLTQKIGQKIWPFPYTEVEKNSAIVLYGAGKVGQDYYWQISSSEYCSVVLWLDRRFLREDREYLIQGWLDRLCQQKFDKIVIALSREEDARNAILLLKEQGVAENKIVWKTETGGNICP